jgi:response regulator NasT
MPRVAPEQAPLKVVIVEDDTTVRQFLREALEQRLGHQVVGEAGTGPDMVRVVQETVPDLIIFDIHLPHLNGLDALRQIYRDRAVPAVAITADRDQELVKRAMEEHVLAYLVKPVEDYQLGPAISVAWARFGELQVVTEERDNLRQSLANRKIIERAKGVLLKR